MEFVSWDDDIPNIYGKIKHSNHQPDPMVFLWFSYAFPMLFQWFLRDDFRIRAPALGLSHLRRCRFDAKVIADLEHLAAKVVALDKPYLRLYILYT